MPTNLIILGVPDVLSPVSICGSQEYNLFPNIEKDETYRNIVGSHGLGRRNHKGQMLIDFCERNGLIVTNTWFKKPKRRLYTWKAPGDWSRHQLDYILVKYPFRKSVKDVQTAGGRY